MALVTDNIFIRGISGLVGNSMLFKTRNGKTFVYSKPRLPQKESLKQKENRSKFRDATVFAKAMMSDAIKKAEYAQKAKKLNLPNAYTAAITEFMRKPEINNINMKEFTDLPEGNIKLEVMKKDFEVESVEVLLLDKEGEILESGIAKRNGKTQWVYNASTSFISQKPHKLWIRAWDRTGNFDEKELCLRERFAGVNR